MEVVGALRIPFAWVTTFSGGIQSFISGASFSFVRAICVLLQTVPLLESIPFMSLSPFGLANDLLTPLRPSLARMLHDMFLSFLLELDLVPVVVQRNHRIDWVTELRY